MKIKPFLFFFILCLAAAPGMPQAVSNAADEAGTLSEEDGSFSSKRSGGPMPYEVSRSCHGKVCLVKYSNGHWQMLLDGRPFIVKGIEYSPDKTGTRPKHANEWMKSDLNGNGKIDGPYDSFIDANRNNIRDNGEKPAGDFKLLNLMGCNTIRIYHPTGVDKKLLRDLHRNYGIYVIMGNFLGAYTVGSGAEWECGTDYTDKKQREKMKSEVRKMVKEFKDEPYVLMWMLGNENDSIGSYENSTYNNTNACTNPEAYASFVGEVSRMIKELDQDHPVAVCNALYKIVPYYKQYAPEIDIIGMNSYSGPYGFGVLWRRVKGYFDRPVLITEFGVDSYNSRTNQVDEEFQELYHKKAWEDIEANSFLGSGAGNSIGGVVFTWLDKWWLCGMPDEHDTETGSWEGPTNDGKFQDEWMGVCSQGDGTASPFLRQPKKVYYLYKDTLWK